MIKKELLAPAGSMEALRQAVFNGADAVYVGGKAFGARKFATNFTHLELMTAIKLCHLYDVKIYVTMNTLVFEEEIESFLEEIKFLYEQNVDAVIMQDIGMIYLVKKMFPNLEIHASTQMHNHNQASVNALESLGVKRVVLARELSLSEITTIKTPLEKEVFIHGALCISYSGCCLFSSLCGGRSGNRGECVGSCRLPYALYQDQTKLKSDGDYLLSMRELNTAPFLEAILESDICSLKIEGRMKSPAYVGFITRYYRNLIDQYEKTGHINLDLEQEKSLKSLFTREFTTGHLFVSSVQERMNSKTPNHIGNRIGQVIEVNPSKLKIRLEEDLTQEDGIRFLESGKGMIVNRLYDLNGLLIHQAKCGQSVIVDNKIGLTEKETVHKTQDHLLLKSLEKLPTKKIPIAMKLIAKVGEPLCLQVIDHQENTVVKKGLVVEQAKKAPLTKEQIKKQLERIKETPFYLEEVTIDTDDAIFIVLSELNRLRRQVLQELIAKRENRTYLHEIKPLLLPKLPEMKRTKDLWIQVNTLEQLKVVQNKDVEIITTDRAVKLSLQNQRLSFYKLPRVNTNYNIEGSLMITELGGLTLDPCEHTLVSDYTMNVVNHYTVYYLEKQGISAITLSEELTDRQIKNIVDGYVRDFNRKPPLIKLLYGQIELMLMKYCPVQLVLKTDANNCCACQQGKPFYLVDRKKVPYQLQMEKEITRVLSPLKDQTNRQEHYRQLGIDKFSLYFTEQSPSQIREIIDRATISKIR